MQDEHQRTRKASLLQPQSLQLMSASEQFNGQLSGTGSSCPFGVSQKEVRADMNVDRRAAFVAGGLRVTEGE